MDPLKGVVPEFLSLVTDDGARETNINRDGKGTSEKDYFKSSPKKGSDDSVSDEPVIQSAHIYEKRNFSFERSPEKFHPDSEARREIMRDALRDILKNPACTNTEKQLARLDLDFEKMFSRLDPEGDKRILNSTVPISLITNMIHAFNPGVPGKILEDLVSNAIRDYIKKYLDNLGQKKSGNKSNKPGELKKTIKKLETKFEKVLGQYQGINFDIKTIMNIVLTEIAAATPGPVNRLLASITKETSRIVSRYDEQAGSELAKEGLKAIINNPISTEEEKTIAKSCIDYSSYNLSPGKKLDNKIKALDRIIEIPDEE
jgi:hypothetical protein